MFNLHYLIMAFIAVCFVLTVLACYIEPIPSSAKAVVQSILMRSMSISKSRYFNYERIQMFIKQYGVSYMMYESINPVMYIIIKILVGLFLSILAMIQIPNILLFVFVFVMGFFGVDVLVRLNNSSDNKEMMEDIANTYDILKIQMRAGVFITDAIYFCYQNCTNKRLKDGFLGLYLDIKSSGNIKESLGEFNSKFKNNNISTLCAVLEQSLSTGQSAEILADISKKNVDIQKLYNSQYKRKIDGKYHRLGILIIVGLFAVIFYMTEINLSSTLSNF